MLMPSIALPTGPYDWRPDAPSRAVFDQRLAQLRDVMRARGVSHCVVHGNSFDHAALHWLANFTPKLGPALALVALEQPPRLLFSGGPGMKPSAARLTWIEDVAALRGMGKDVAAWLAGGDRQGVGLLAGASILLGDWNAINEAAGVDLIELDEAIDALTAEVVSASAYDSVKILTAASTYLFETAKDGDDLLATVLDAERLAYRSGAQDVRMRVARRPWGPPTTLPDRPTRISGCLPVALAVRGKGAWAYGSFVLGDIAAFAAEIHSLLIASHDCAPLVNRVAFPEPLTAAPVGVSEARVEARGARWSGLFRQNPHSREFLWLPPGL